MNIQKIFWLTMVFLVGAIRSLDAQEVLASWNDTASKQAISAFVARVCAEGSSDYVPPSQRIAVFDNDGTLWAEQPMYFQAFFAMDRIRSLASSHPEWKEKQPHASILNGDRAWLSHVDEKGLLELVMETHAGTTSEEFEQLVRQWIASARHPKTGRLYSEMVYQPMLELLDYLHRNQFKTFIVSGGGIEFMRAWVESVYGIPPERVIGSSIKSQYEIRNGKPAIVRLPAIQFIDDKAGKPVGIQQHIGRRPILAVGNSDGDFEMLEWTTSGSGARLGILVHHDDADREFAYDRDSHVGKLSRGLDESPARGWSVVSMKRDWKQIHPNRESVVVADKRKLIGDWLCEDIEHRGVLDRAESTLRFAEDGTVSGNTSVNLFGGKVTVEGNKITFAELQTTRRAGTPALMDQETRYTQALMKVASYRIDENGLLFLLDATGKELLRFSRRTP
jgi:heat shock protein HslJ/phosphoglycolate phosphatase-like HAD superfamily hydrolase